MSDHVLGAADTFLQNGQMKRLDLEGTPVVVARVGGNYYAFGGNCSHYGAPLDEGVLKGHTLLCPWHHACFDVRSGVRLEPPALNDLPHYPVRIEGGQLTVTLPNPNEVEPQGKADAGDQHTFVIVGGGSAGNAAAEELRRSGYKGRIVMISAVSNVPVDRPNLSKDYLAGKAQPDWIPLRGDKSWYDARDIELHMKTHVTTVDPKAHTVSLDHGQPLHYDKLLLATGGIPRRLPGDNLKGVHTLRTLADADAILEAVQKNKRVVIVGASFIGMEVAASLASGQGASVTVVGIEEVPFDRILGVEIGRMVQKEHEDNGIKFWLKSEIDGFSSKEGHVTDVRLKGGETIPADFVIMGVGVRPATDFLANSGLALDEKDRSVRVDSHLRSSDADIYAAGDIARWDADERGTRIEHWRVAEQQGIVAARNMLGRSEDVNNRVPFFWTNQWALTLNYIGHAEKWDEIIFRGKPETKDFIAFYVAGGKLLAATTSNHDREADAIEFILRDHVPLTPAQMRDESFDLVAHAVG